MTLTVEKSVLISIAKQLDLPEFPATTDRICGDLRADSLDFVEIIMGVEDDLGLDMIADEDLKKIVTVQDLIDLIERMQGDNN